MTINEAIQILGLQQPVTAVKIKQQYRAKAREFHPDASGVDTNSEFVKINLAYETLKHKTEFELNNQIFKTRVDFTTLHKPADTRGFYQLPNTVLMQDFKNVIYFFYKYFKINWVDIFYTIYTKVGHANRVNRPIKYLQTIAWVALIILGLPLMLAFLFCSTAFYLIQNALLVNNEKLKHQSYYIILRQILMSAMAILFFYIAYSLFPTLLAIAIIVFTLPAICLVQISLLYSFLNKE
ncbi:MAG: DnaJ domain-containing protein [Bacteroidota bacterium]|nr:DnaJ domain-containing protein [Bacteroidota bacterium]